MSNLPINLFALYCILLYSLKNTRCKDAFTPDALCCVTVPRGTASGENAAQRTRNTTKQVAAVLTAKDRIAAATYRITLAHAVYSANLTIGQEMLIKLCGESGPHLIHGPLSPPESIPKTESRLVHPFLQLMHSCDKHTHTDD